MIKLDELSYSIDGKYLVDDISLNINNGSVTSIIGPNGSGKSTLIKLISNELEPSKGYVFLKGIKNESWGKRDLARFRSVLTQANYLSFPFSVIDIVKMGRFPFESTKEDNDDICIKLIKMLDLESHINQNYVTLSGGEKQRVQLARVLAQIWSSESYDDKLLILDEPTSFLDINHQCSLFNLLKDFNNKGLTIIMVLHDINQAIQYSDKIIMLKESKLINYGDVKEIINSESLEKLFNIKLDLFTNKNTGKTNISFIENE